MVRTLRFLAALLSVSLLGMQAVGAEPKVGQSGTEAKELFENQIEPILVKHCYDCHSKKSDEIEGGLELDSPLGMMRGGDSGPILVPHEVEKSPLIRMLRHEEGVSEMPPDEPLPEEVVHIFEKWIRLGAPDSRNETGPTRKEQQVEAARSHWSFQPPRSISPPAIQQADWPRDEIDHFVLSRLEAEGLKPLGDANRQTLVRRVYFDLIGLPPTPQQVDAFINDESPDALAKLIDQLLDSPRFGERWGRHWLDVVRFAESSGMEFNFTYPHAWPYRNYVIDSLNQDKPYDLFLREQIAGDLLPKGENESEKAVQSRHVATSLLAFGPKRHNSGGVEYQMDIADDQIDTVCRAMLAMTVSCARCHDHKFDPVPTTDYYALAGIFLSTEPLYGTIKQKYSNNPTELLPIGENAVAMHSAAEEYSKKMQESEKALASKREALKKLVEDEKLAAKKKADSKKLVAAAAKDQLAKTDAAMAESIGSAPEPDVHPQLDQATAELAAKKEQIVKLTAEVASLEAKDKELKKNQPPRPHYAMTARDRAKPADTKVAIRGNFRKRGDVVPRGFPSAFRITNTPQIDPTHSGRLELAQWIASPDHPLTARVMVNRIWHHLFGRGLVSTVDNFGVIGKTPSHPQLLDSLALRFVHEEWSVKRMIRSMMLSRTYQLSSAMDEANMKIDPDNCLLWRATPRRLEAEAIRDAILSVSGQIDLKPPIGSTVTPLGDQLVRGIPVEKIQPPSNHRSIYLPVVRDYVPELFDLFDFPSPSLVSGRRSVTNVPSQALYLRNSTFVAEQATHAARRLLAEPEAKDDAERVDLAMRWSLAHGANEAERDAAIQLVQQIRQADPDNAERDVNAWAAWFHTLFTTAEFRYLVDIR